jgi:hypothetical protein
MAIESDTERRIEPEYIRTSGYFVEYFEHEKWRDNEGRVLVTT